mmetsp:Transcript_913/g.1640  ORF Transcript_913/g.1640 Transcript_913/m.1640 type:complete len:132 (+) Transcript_913:827-1222(+)
MKGQMLISGQDIIVEEIAKESECSAVSNRIRQSFSQAQHFSFFTPRKQERPKPSMAKRASAIQAMLLKFHRQERHTLVSFKKPVKKPVAQGSEKFLLPSATRTKEAAGPFRNSSVRHMGQLANMKTFKVQM